MRDGTCGRCGGTEIYAAANGLAIGGPSQAALHAHIGPGFRGMRPSHQNAGLWQYLCADCGHLELHLLDAAAIQFARAHWVRVPPQDAPPA